MLRFNDSERRATSMMSPRNGLLHRLDGLALLCRSVLNREYRQATGLEQLLGDLIHLVEGQDQGEDQGEVAHAGN